MSDSDSDDEFLALATGRGSKKRQKKKQAKKKAAKKSKKRSADLPRGL